MPQLWQQIVTGQAKSITLLVGALVLFAYFLPSVVAFARGHRRFWPIFSGYASQIEAAAPAEDRDYCHGRIDCMLKNVGMIPGDEPGAPCKR